MSRLDNFPYLSVGELKKSLESLPDDMPVAYQRIEDFYFVDYGWKTEKLTWDTPILIALDEHGNKVYEENISEYIVAFSAYKHPEKDIFVINAHY